MMWMCDCGWAECIAPGTIPRCQCGCHDDRDFDLATEAIIARRSERCTNCRYAAYSCSRGLCYCECHGDRPNVKSPEPVVTPGHDAEGHERAYAHVRIFRSVEPDLERLINLRDAYRPVHPEHTIGGA